MKKFSSFLSIVLTLAIVFGNFSLPVFAYDKGGVNFEQARTKTLSNNSRNNLNKINSSSQEIKNLSFSSSINAKEKTGLEKSQQTKGRKDYVEGEILVKYKDTKINLNTTSGRVASLNFNKSKSLEKKEDLAKNNISVLKIKDAKTVEQKIAELKNDSNIEYAQPNFQYYSTNISSNDTYRTNLWGLDNTGQTINGSYGNITGTNDKDIDAPEAWAINEGTNSSTIVAVIDSGVAYNHPDLINNMWNGVNCKDENGGVLGECNHGYDYEDGDNTPLPTTSSHGTHVAGTIAAVKNNTKGIIGVAPQAKIMALKSSLTTIDNVKSINFAKQNGAKVINASWATYSTIVGGYYDVALYNAIGGFPGLFVVAAGNGNNTGAGFNHDDGVDTHKSYPAGFKITTPIGPGLNNIISVAATDQNDALSTFSDYGATSVDVGSPGTNIYSTIADTSVMSENFNSVTTPNLPNGWIKGGINNKWATYDFSGDKVLYGQVPSFPYDNDTNSFVTSPTYNLSNNISGATINFGTRCDTEYTNTDWFDYMALEVSSDGVNFTEILKWDEATLDYLNGDSSDVGGAFYSFEKVIPTQYLSSNFKFRLRWFADPYVNEYDGCWVDDVKITKFSDGSDEKYGYYDGTSMATPHVAGLASLIEGYNPSLTSEQVKNAILTTGDSVASLSGKTITGKRINAQSALQSVNPAKVITAFNFIAPTATGVVINETDHTISATVPFGTNVAELIPTITITGVSVSPLGGVANNFTTPQTYTVTAADGSTQSYVVSVVFAPNPAKAITAFSFTTPVATGVINESAKTIDISVPFGTNITSLTPTITFTGVSVSPLSGVAQNFTNPVTYTVTAEDASIQAYVVTVVNRDEVALKISESSNNPDASTIEVDDNSDTNDVVMFKFKIKAENSDVTINNINLVLTGTGATPAEIANNIKIKAGGYEVAISDDILGVNGTYDFTFDNDLVIQDGYTTEFSVYADINDLEGNFTQGDSLKIDYANVTAVDAYDIPVTSVSGSANGNIQTFYSKGIFVNKVSTTTTVTAGNPGLTSDLGTFNITFDVTAFGGDIWIDKTAPSLTGGVNESDIDIAGDGTTESIITSNGATSGTNGFLVPEGNTERFTITTIITPTTSGLFKVKLTDLLHALTDVNGNLHFTSLDGFETPNIYLNTVIILDTTKPVITLNGTDSMELTVGDTFTDPGATALDNVDGNITSNIVTINPVDENTIGTYTITYNVSDSAGNAAIEVTRIVDVVDIVSTPDTTAPVITLNGVTPDIEVGDSYTELGATAIDNIDGSFTATPSGSVDTNIVGTYTITYNATDVAGNVATPVTRMVNIIFASPTFDTTAPTITLLGDSTINLTVGDSYTDAGATASDDVDGDITINIVVTGLPIDTSIPDTYTIHYNVSDVANNPASEVTRTLNVESAPIVDTEPPVITLNGSATVDLTVGDTYDELGAIATDNVDDSVTVIIDGDTVDTNIAGTYQVTYDASDEAENNAIQVIRTVTVSETPIVDTTPPVIVLNGSSTINLIVGDIYNEEGAIATDNVDGTVDVTIGGDAVITDTPATFTITYDAIDSAENNATQVTRTVIVSEPAPDTTAPIITLNGSNPMNLIMGDTFTDPGATATDVVDGSVAVITSGLVDTVVVGVYTITYTATDMALNVATTTRTINVGAPVVLDSIAITTPANKLSYPVGDALDIAGLIVTGTYSDATTKVETITISNVTGFSSATPITGQVLTITVGNKTTTYVINIVAVSSGGGGGGSGSSNPPADKKGDNNGDGKVDKYDFSLMMANWGKTGTNTSDFNGDGKVDKYDFALLMSNWGL